MKIRKLLIGILFFIIIITSCKTQNILTSNEHNSSISNTKNFVYDSSYQYTIRKDDKINISVWDNADLSVGSVYDQYNSNEVYGKWLLVDGNGEVAVPKIGNIKIEGFTTNEAQEMLKKILLKWLINPVVTVRVMNKEITVLGEVKIPGKFTVDKDKNFLLDLIGQAGDFDFYADKKNIEIIRAGKDSVEKVFIDLTVADNYPAKNILLKPGDVVYVPARKGKQWDKRSGSTIIPITAIVTTGVVLLNLLK